MVEIKLSPLSCSPKPPLANDISAVEEGHISPSHESTENVNILVFPTIAHKIIAELLGTYVIIFMGCGSIMIEQKYPMVSVIGVAVTWGLAVMVMIYTFGHISGGHFNSAVTIAFAASGRFPWRQVPAFVASQIAGSTLAVLTLVVMFHQNNTEIHKTVDICNTVTQYQSPTSDLEALGWEFIISFVLMLTICGVATDSRAINELSGVAVGATVLINIIIAGKITGASMNPARSIGPALVTVNFHNLWVYIFAPILGTITACMIYSLLRAPPMHENCDKNNPKRF